jgi:putative ABC transport system permease protein
LRSTSPAGSTSFTAAESASVTRWSRSPPSFQVDRIGSLTSIDLNLAPVTGDPLRLSALLVSRDLIDLFGVETIAGRPFTADEDRAGGPPVAMISAGLWAQLFARDQAAMGATIRLNGIDRTIVGVVSPSADFGVLQILSSAAYARGFADRDPRTRVDVWLPLQPDPSTAPRGGNHGYIMVEHLAPGASVSSAHEEMVQMAADLERTYPRDDDGRGAFVESLDGVVLGRTRAALGVLMVAVSLVLLISCVNVANLLLARGTARVREVAVRTALGAELPRLARQFVVETSCWR